MPRPDPIPTTHGQSGTLCNGWDPSTCPDGPSRDRFGGWTYDDRPYCEGSWILPTVYARREFAIRLGVDENRVDALIYEDDALSKEFFDREQELAEIEYHKPQVVCPPVRFFNDGPARGVTTLR